MISNRQRQLSHFSRHAPRTQLLHLLFALLFLLQLLPNRIVVGIGIVIWGAFGFQTREKVLDVGPIHASKDKEHNVPYGPLAGGLLALGGVVLLVKGKA